MYCIANLFWVCTNCGSWVCLREGPLARPYGNIKRSCVGPVKRTGSRQLVDSKEPTSLEFPWRPTRASGLPGFVEIHTPIILAFPGSSEHFLTEEEQEGLPIQSVFQTLAERNLDGCHASHGSSGDLCEPSVPPEAHLQPVKVEQGPRTQS